jgi:hypothetical protein
MIDDASPGESSRSEFVKQLREGSNFLDTHRGDITSLWDQTAGIQIVSFYETRTTAVVKKVTILRSILHYTLCKFITDIFFSLLRAIGGDTATTSKWLKIILLSCFGNPNIAFRLHVITQTW